VDISIEPAIDHFQRLIVLENVVLKNMAASGFLMGSPNMLWLNPEKTMHLRAEGLERPSPRHRPTFNTAWPKSGGQG